MILIRPCQDEDLDAVTHIYRHHVLHGTATFETSPPSVDDMRQRCQDVRAKGLPWLVATRHGDVVGYAYANWFRPRAAFRYCAEDSIYLAREATGQGIGRALLAELMSQCERAGMRKLVAVIGDSANDASIGLHRSMGFEPVGTLAHCGWKFNRWLDIVMMERSLGAGSGAPPAVSGAELSGAAGH